MRAHGTQQAATVLQQAPTLVVLSCIASFMPVLKAAHLPRLSQANLIRERLATPCYKLTRFKKNQARLCQCPSSSFCVVEREYSILEFSARFRRKGGVVELLEKPCSGSGLQRIVGWKPMPLQFGTEFELSRSLIEARARAKLTQAELARRMNTTQSVVARLESGRTRPSIRTLEKIAQATSIRLHISFDPY